MFSFIFSFLTALPTLFSSRQPLAMHLARPQCGETAAQRYMASKFHSTTPFGPPKPTRNGSAAPKFGQKSREIDRKRPKTAENGRNSGLEELLHLDLGRLEAPHVGAEGARECEHLVLRELHPRARRHIQQFGACGRPETCKIPAFSMIFDDFQAFSGVFHGFSMNFHGVRWFSMVFGARKGPSSLISRWEKEFCAWQHAALKLQPAA